MLGRSLFLVPLLLGLCGCAIGDGVAHVVKLTEQRIDGKPATPAAAPEQAAAVGTEATPPPPPPDPRDSVKVEDLAPPPH